MRTGQSQANVELAKEGPEADREGPDGTGMMLATPAHFPLKAMVDQESVPSATSASKAASSAFPGRGSSRLGSSRSSGTSRASI